MSRRAVFLDRDGVINRAVIREGKPYPPASLAELEIPPTVRGHLQALRRAGFLLIVVTNQPDVARGTQTRQMVEAIHLALQAQLPLDQIMTCYHDDSANCSCRKPKPGLLMLAAAEFQIELDKSYLIGDRWRDIEAAQRVACPAIFIDYGYAERQPEEPYIRALSLADAVDWILGKEARS